MTIGRKDKVERRHWTVWTPKLTNCWGARMSFFFARADLILFIYFILTCFFFFLLHFLPFSSAFFPASFFLCCLWTARFVSVDCWRGPSWSDARKRKMTTKSAGMAPRMFQSCVMRIVRNFDVFLLLFSCCWRCCCWMLFAHVVR